MARIPVKGEYGLFYFPLTLVIGKEVKRTYL